MQSQSPFKEDALAGKVALVTGGGSGIGLEISRYLGTLPTGASSQCHEHCIQPARIPAAVKISAGSTD